MPQLFHHHLNALKSIGLKIFLLDSSVPRDEAQFLNIALRQEAWGFNVHAVLAFNTRVCVCAR